MLGRFTRTSFITLSKADWAQRLVTGWGLARRAASRFVAGEGLEQALRVIQQLNERGISATLDFLGESTTRPAEARASAAEVIRALEAIDAAGARSNVSIKLSQMGLALDEALCRENLARVLRRAGELGTFIRIDMEDSSLTGRTLETWRWAQQQGLAQVGVVLQAYLYRSEQDLCQVVQAGGRVRLCKGAYDEPVEVAFAKKGEVDANYDKLASLLLAAAQKAGAPQASGDGRTPPLAALATHDAARIAHAQAEARRLALPKGALEFQMLYGIRRDLQEQLAGQGYPVRVYVPYGTHWYPYFMRRLAERPANIWFFVSNFFRR